LEFIETGRRAPREGKMGVGLRCRGVFHKRPFLPFGNRDLLDRARASAAAFAEAAGFGPYLDISPEPGRLWIFLYPGEEPIQLAQLEGGGLMCTAKTSTIGPGYHRLVVELMDRLGEDFRLRWA
jgi:hypothetical protein